MATLQVESGTRNQLTGLLKELSDIKETSLARKELGNDLSFESGVVFFSRTLRLFHALSENDLEELPNQLMKQIVNLASETIGLYRNILNFSTANYPNNPINQRDGLITQARDQYDSIFSTVAPAVAFTLRKGADLERLEDQAKHAIQRINEVSAAHTAAMETTRENAEQVVKELRRMAQEAGVSQHAIHFKVEAEEQEHSAKVWLIATICLSGVTILASGGLLVRYLFTVMPTLTPSQSFQIAIPKIFAFSVLLSATVWAGRTYRACRHNAVVNRHRQNALATFQAFAKATDDEATKNAVLLQATQCIFLPQQTGYIHGESEIAMPQVLEVVRNFGK